MDVLLKETKNDCITLTIRRNVVPDFMYENQCRQNAVTYANYQDIIANAYNNGFGINNNGSTTNNNNNNVNL